MKPPQPQVEYHLDPVLLFFGFIQLRSISSLCLVEYIFWNDSNICSCIYFKFDFPVVHSLFNHPWVSSRSNRCKKDIIIHFVYLLDNFGEAHTFEMSLPSRGQTLPILTWALGFMLIGTVSTFGTFSLAFNCLIRKFLHTKNYRGITLTSIVAKIYNALLHNCIEPKIEKILRKNQNGFWRNQPTTSQILTIHRILEGVNAKNLDTTILFIDFPKAFDSIHRGKTEQILLANSLPKETVAAIMMLYKNTKVKVCSPDGNTDYSDIVASVLQGDTLAPYPFIICLDYVLRTSIDLMKENSFKLPKERSRRYPTQTNTDLDYADDIALLANTPTQAKTLRHILEWAVAGIGLHVNAD